jgi:hypothetical protein
LDRRKSRSQERKGEQAGKPGIRPQELSSSIVSCKNNLPTRLLQLSGGIIWAAKSAGNRRAGGWPVAVTGFVRAARNCRDLNN